MGFEDFITMGAPGWPTTSAAFAKGWAEATLRHIESYQAAHKAYAQTMRTAELMDLDVGPSPERDAAAWHQLWAEGHLLLVAAKQTHTWLTSHNEEDDDPHMQLVIPTVGHLKHLRNSLEHLSEADLSGGAAVAIEGGGTWSLNKLPNKALSLFIHVGPSQAKAFEVIDIDDIEEFANQVIYEVERVSDYLASEMANPY